MRLCSLFAALVAPCLLAVAVTGAATGCGRSEPARWYDDYASQVDPLLDQENERWKTIGGLLKKRADDAAMPRYYRYVRDKALPYYTEFLDAVNGLRPEGTKLQAAHAEFVRFAEARLEFMHLEERGHEVYRRATEDSALIRIQSGVQEADLLEAAYLKAVGDGTPDAKYGELHQILDPFIERYFKPMQRQAIDPAEVQVRLRSHVIRALKELQRRKFRDDEADRLLKQCISAWTTWYELLESKCPLLQEVMQSKQNSERAAKAAEAAFQEFAKQLAQIRLEL